MKKKRSDKYTTIQISKEINEHIKLFCKERGFVTATITERFWSQFISSSASGSISVI